MFALRPDWDDHDFQGALGARFAFKEEAPNLRASSQDG